MSHPRTIATISGRKIETIRLDHSYSVCWKKKEWLSLLAYSRFAKQNRLKHVNQCDRVSVFIIKNSFQPNRRHCTHSTSQYVSISTFNHGFFVLSSQAELYAQKRKRKPIDYYVKCEYEIPKCPCSHLFFDGYGKNLFHRLPMFVEHLRHTTHFPEIQADSC